MFKKSTKSVIILGTNFLEEAMKPELKKIFDNFSIDFNTTYKYMTGKQRREIAYLAPTLFIRWYYSALFPETILSPATIAETQKDFVVPEKGFYSVCSHFKNVTGESIDFTFTENFYSLEKHPVYDDIDKFMNYISPAFTLDDDYRLNENDIKTLQKKLSISDRYYVIYIYNLSQRLGLFRELPSLCGKCIQPNFDAFYFSLEGKDRLKTIVDASCSICAATLNTDFPFEEGGPDSDMIREFIENPIPIDDIFIKLYGSSGSDLEHLWKRSEEGDMLDGDSAMLSSMFYLGVVLDRVFIFVFGYYLRLIKPLYSFPVDFRKILNSLFTAIAIDGEREFEVFMPCTSYVHTPLGRIFFKDERKPEKVEPKYPPIPLDKVLETIEADTQLKKIQQASDMEGCESEDIYIVKTILNGDREKWKKIEIECSIPVCSAADQILMMFMISPANPYNISVRRKGKNQAYVSFFNTNTISETYSSLEELISETGESIMLDISDGNKIEITLTNIIPACGEIIYPRITEQSKKITEEEHQMYSFD